MTIFGKIFVYLIVCLSLVALGISVWVAIDRREWQAERKAIGEEIYRRQKALDMERGALIVLLDEINKGSRQMPWDPDVAATPTSVRATTQQVKQLADANELLFSELGGLRVGLNTNIDALRQEREKYNLATAEQKRLRQEIKPDDPNQKGFRDLTADHRAAKEAAEVAQEALKPDVMNELVRVAKIKARLDELSARAKELQGTPTGSTVRKP